MTVICVIFLNLQQDFGLECANWSPQVYQDLRLGGDGTAEGMLTTFFEMVWRTFLSECHYYFHRCENTVKRALISTRWAKSLCLVT